MISSQYFPLKTYIEAQDKNSNLFNQTQLAIESPSFLSDELWLNPLILNKVKYNFKKLKRVFMEDSELLKKMFPDKEDEIEDSFALLNSQSSNSSEKKSKVKEIYKFEINYDNLEFALEDELYYVEKVNRKALKDLSKIVRKSYKFPMMLEEEDISKICAPEQYHIFTKSRLDDL